MATGFCFPVCLLRLLGVAFEIHLVPSSKLCALAWLLSELVHQAEFTCLRSTQGNGPVHFRRRRGTVFFFLLGKVTRFALRVSSFTLRVARCGCAV